MQPRVAVAMVIAAVALMAACNREERELRPSPAASQVINETQVSGINPGDHPLPEPPTPSIYEESAYSVSQGKTLFDQYNCSGCHANGGGGIGPPLMDNNWIYGSQPQNIFTTIVEGRPNGMPSFRNRIPEYQVWELVAYVRSLSGLLPKDVAPARGDQLHVKPPPASMPKQAPVEITGEPQK
jgi:cytochrome c oxidase cbb3-type subunit III